MNDNATLQKLLIKILNKIIIDRFHNELSKNSISHSELSIKAGKSPSAFNKNFNSCEQLTLASFLRYSYAATSLLGNKSINNQFSLDNLIARDELKLISMICISKDIDLHNFSQEEILFLKHYKVYFDYLKKNNKLTKDEVNCFYNYIIRKDVF